MTPQDVVNRWNLEHAVGARVFYRRDNGTDTHTATRTAAYVLSGHTAVIFLHGVSGCVALHRVRARP